MRKCENCFRYMEDWRDAENKGLKARHFRFMDYSYKPRPGVKPRCIMGKLGDKNPCEYHEYRWTWNIKLWWKWRFMQSIGNWYRVNIRVPLGSMRKPVPLKYKDYFDGMRDIIIPGAEPECPRCGEMPYSYEQCVFCGQKFEPECGLEEKLREQEW